MHDIWRTVGPRYMAGQSGMIYDRQSGMIYDGHSRAWYMAAVGHAVVDGQSCMIYDDSLGTIMKVSWAWYSRTVGHDIWRTFWHDIWRRVGHNIYVRTVGNDICRTVGHDIDGTVIACYMTDSRARYLADSLSTIYGLTCMVYIYGGHILARYTEGESGTVYRYVRQSGTLDAGQSSHDKAPQRQLCTLQDVNLYGFKYWILGHVLLTDQNLEIRILSAFVYVILCVILI